MEENFVGEELLCPIKSFMDVAGGKWKASILCILSDNKPHRYGRIKKKLGTITNAMLAQSLQQLEDDGLIERIQYNEIPPRVEYSLNEKGESIIPVLVDMARWSNENMMQEGRKFGCKECRGK